GEFTTQRPFPGEPGAGAPTQEP
ncbi:MAG: hypothetical protein QOC85_3627, partial [Streptomyces sp.]|nr:hypothetical protein [Streptomyces sp.]